MSGSSKCHFRTLSASYPKLSDIKSGGLQIAQKDKPAIVTLHPRNREADFHMDQESFFAFVLMPFSPKFSDIYRFGIKEAAAELDIRAERVDEQIYAEGMLERIYNQIAAADIVIADMSEKNANVFYEVGYAHGQRKLCILLTQEADSIPFDLKHHRHLVYNGSIKELREQLRETLKWAKEEVLNSRSSKISVDLKDCHGTVDAGRFTAKGRLYLTFELRNQTDQPSAEIEQISLYTREGWTLFQDGKECPQTASDLPQFDVCHSLVATPSIRRLATRNAWAQVKCEARRVLASAIKGEEVKNSYHISGRAVLRVATSSGNFDYEQFIDAEIEDIPF